MHRAGVLLLLATRGGGQFRVLRAPPAGHAAHVRRGIRAGAIRVLEGTQAVEDVGEQELAGGPSPAAHRHRDLLAGDIHAAGLLEQLTELAQNRRLEAARPAALGEPVEQTPGGWPGGLEDAAGFHQLDPAAGTGDAHQLADDAGPGSSSGARACARA
ncbi:hypothetical protein A4R35_09765 [Thermogemmatispora tikiterensis]|uniref:Uncharacterized protein n=1 Tax=Thermogemmatispora tikiterensis TaxID=1825093 RepID=A0A328VI94_9CHLR|nr:hypothetical protein A4R35_09765 [Thermogemmatispora tikiterensis]